MKLRWVERVTRIRVPGTPFDEVDTVRVLQYWEECPHIINDVLHQGYWLDVPVEVEEG